MRRPKNQNENVRKTAKNVKGTDRRKIETENLKMAREKENRKMEREEVNLKKQEMEDNQISSRELATRQLCAPS